METLIVNNIDNVAIKKKKVEGREKQENKLLKLFPSGDILYSIKGQGNLYSEIEELIDNANESIYIINWLFTKKEKKEKENKVINALLRANDRLKGRIFVLTNTSKKPRINYESEELQYVDEHYNVLELFNENGIYIKGYENTHAKVLIVDEKKFVITSANFTVSAFMKNIEVGILISDAGLVKELVSVFKWLWRNKGIYIYDHEKASPPFNNKTKFLPYFHHNDNIRLCYSFLFDTNESNNANGQISLEKRIDDVMARMIKNTKNELLITTYSLAYDEHKDKENKVIDSLRKLSENHNKISIIMQVSKKNKRNRYFALKSLFNENIKNVKLKCHDSLHSKLLIVDEKEALLFTGNIDKYLTEGKTIDMGIWTSDPEIIANLKKFYEIVCNKSNDMIVSSNKSKKQKISYYKKNGYKIKTGVLIDLILSEQDIKVSVEGDSGFSIKTIKSNFEKYDVLIYRPKHEEKWFIGSLKCLLVGELITNTKNKSQKNINYAFLIKYLHSNGNDILSGEGEHIFPNNSQINIISIDELKESYYYSI